MKKKTVLSVVGVACLAVAGAAVRQAIVRSPKEPIRQALFAAMRPVRLANCTPRRFGSAHDGGYLMCGNLIGQAQSAYSYGIGPADDWGCDVSKARHITVHQYDCFDPNRPTCQGGAFAFHDECVGARTGAPRARKDGRLFDSLANQITRNGDRGKHLLIKMDVEGAEWASLAATADDVLSTVDQLVVEFHGVGKPRYLQVIQKLKKTFYIANAHFNNCCCSNEAWPFPGRVVEILFVNKRLGVVDSAASAAFVPSPLDMPNSPAMHDCQAQWHLQPRPGS
jgi:hypothetical protein